MAVANATAAIVQKAPPYVTYHVHGKKDKRRDGDMRITNIRPLHYETGQSSADAIARSIKGYVVTYAPDATPAAGHLHLERNALMKDPHWMRDVWYDPTSLVPTRILWGGQDDFTLDARYATVGGHWLLRSIEVAAIVHAPMWLGRMTIAIGGRYDGYAFSDVAPDPRLVPAPAPAASPVPGASPSTW